jgi:hypothetical protein
VNHFQAATPFARFAEAGHANARLKLRLLLARKVEKSQCQLPAAITNAYEQITTTTKRSLGQKDLTRHKATGAGDKST